VEMSVVVEPDQGSAAIEQSLGQMDQFPLSCQRVSGQKKSSSACFLSCAG